MLVGNQRRPTEIRAIRSAGAASPPTGTNKPINSSESILALRESALMGKADMRDTSQRKAQERAADRERRRKFGSVWFD